MIRFLLQFIVTGATMLGLSSQLPGFRMEGWKPALVAAVVLGFVNTLVKPVLQLLTFPITIMTLGLWLLILNAAMLWLTQRLVGGFEITNVASLFLGSILLSLVGMVWKAASKDGDSG
ncbi:MAG: phage holin family protein [Candidatus Eisenbacteria bacterium]